MAIGKKTQGKDFNFFKKLDISATSFSDSPDTAITFPNYGLILTNEDASTDVIEYSFNGNTVHGELVPGTTSPSRQMTFLNRQVCLIWFRVKPGSSGPITVRIDAW